MAEFIKIYDENPNQKEIDKVVKVLQNGGLVIYPTDTVYGLGCDITKIKAIEKIAKIKGIKIEKSNFSFVCNSLSHLSDYVKQIDSVKSAAWSLYIYFARKSEFTKSIQKEKNSRDSNSGQFDN